jgi:hypothetical protein
MDLGSSREGPGKGFWGHRSAEVVLTVSDVLLVLSSLSLRVHLHIIFAIECLAYPSFFSGRAALEFSH